MAVMVPVSSTAVLTFAEQSYKVCTFSTITSSQVPYHI